ncbi:6692_t:CDS:2, partial [Acaulospora morrowiae]
PVDFFGDEYDGRSRAATPTRENNMYSFLGEIFRTCRDATAEAMRRTPERHEQVGRETNWVPLTTMIREKENTRNQSYRPTGCFNCGRQGHRARECPEPRRIPPQVTNPRDANLCEVENSDDEAYVATRSRHQLYTINRPKKGELSKEPTGRTVSQPRQTEQARPVQQEERAQPTQPVEMEITAEPTKKNATPRVKRQRGPSVVDQAPLYNVAEDLLRQRANATYAQLLQIPKQRQHLAQVLKRPIITPTEVDYVEDQPQRTSTARCNVKIRNKPVVAVLNSGAAVSIMSKKLLTKLRLQISEPSNAVVITANRTRERALGKLKDIALQLGRITVSTDFQVIESTEEMMLLGMKDLDEVESYLTDDQEDLYTNTWIDEQSPAAYLTTIKEVPTPEEIERPIQPLEGVIEELHSPRLGAFTGPMSLSSTIEASASRQVLKISPKNEYILSSRVGVAALDRPSYSSPKKSTGSSTWAIL